VGCGRIDPTPAPVFTSPDTRNDPFFQAYLTDLPKPTATSKGQGILEGTITWKGPISGEKSWLAPLSPLIQRQNTPVEPRLNPFFPKIQGENEGGGVEGVVVALVEGPVRVTDPWNHGPARVKLRNHLLLIDQDGLNPQVGFLKHGDPLELSMESGDFDTIIGRGAAFFSIPFLRPGDASVRQPRRPGLIHLTSGAGHFWMRTTLVVSAQSLMGRTSAEGHFRFTDIPEGNWQLLCFRPNHLVRNRERDGETLETFLLEMEPPLIGKFPVRIGAGMNRVNLIATRDGFARP